LHFHCAHLGDFFDFSVPIMKKHPKLTIYEVFSQYLTRPKLPPILDRYLALWLPIHVGPDIDRRSPRGP
jgi:hypothetical protein